LGYKWERKFPGSRCPNQRDAGDEKQALKAGDVKFKDRWQRCDRADFA